jgi:hypothetical protein
MNFARRLLLSLPLMTIAGFCLFGFVATFEPMPRGEQWLWRGIYLCAGSGSVLTICWMWLGKRARRAA